MASTLIKGKKRHIYIRFRWNNQQYCLPSTHYCQGKGEKGCKCSQCRLANLLSQDIERKILLKEFTLASYFPETAKVLTQTKVDKLKNADKIITFGKYSQQWLNLMDGTLAYSTMRTYKAMIRRTTPIIGKEQDISKITYSDVQNVSSALRKLGLATKTIRNAVGTLNSMFNAAYKDRLIQTNPARGVIVRNVPMSEDNVDEADEDVTNKVFSEREMRKILKYLKTHHEKHVLFFAIGFYTGARTGEILALRWTDIDLENKKIRISKTRTNQKLKMIPKSGKARNVVILPELEPYVIEHEQHIKVNGHFITPEADLFINKNNEPYKSMNSIVSQFWKPALDALGLTYRIPYFMRHTFACHMIDKGRNIKWISRMLGHADLTMLMKIYGNKLINEDNDF